jgi:DNA-directed RNA polymerase specialized sigma24 family protein
MGAIATTEEFFKAFEALGERDRIGMLAAARRCAGGNCGFDEAEDLVNELVVRVMEGRRKWPSDVPIMAFMVFGFRSIANGGRRQARNKLPHLSLDSCADEPDLHLHFQANPHPSAEDELIAAQSREAGRAAVDFARRSLVDDPLGLQVLEGMACDMTPAEMREAFGVGKAELHAARGRVNARLSVGAERQAARGHRRITNRNDNRTGRAQ